MAYHYLSMTMSLVISRGRGKGLSLPRQYALGHLSTSLDAKKGVESPESRQMGSSLPSHEDRRDGNDSELDHADPYTRIGAQSCVAGPNKRGYRVKEESERIPS